MWVRWRSTVETATTSSAAISFVVRPAGQAPQHLHLRRGQAGRWGRRRQLRPGARRRAARRDLRGQRLGEALLQGQRRARRPGRRVGRLPQRPPGQVQPLREERLAERDQRAVWYASLTALAAAPSRTARRGCPSAAATWERPARGMARPHGPCTSWISASALPEAGRGPGPSSPSRRATMPRRCSRTPTALLVAELPPDRQAARVVGPRRRVVGLDVGRQPQQVQRPGDQPGVPHRLGDRQALLAQRARRGGVVLVVGDPPQVVERQGRRPAVVPARGRAPGSRRAARGPRAESRRWCASQPAPWSAFMRAADRSGGPSSARASHRQALVVVAAQPPEPGQRPAQPAAPRSPRAACRWLPAVPGQAPLQGRPQVVVLRLQAESQDAPLRARGASARPPPPGRGSGPGGGPGCARPRPPPAAGRAAYCRMVSSSR